jgi:hypothetical protein
VNVTSGSNAALVRVAPGNTAGSTVFLMLNSASPSGTCDSMRANLVGNPDHHVDVLRSWILNNAPNN